MLHNFYFSFYTVHTNICTNKDGHVHRVGSVALVAIFMMVLHYVHANYNT